MGLDDLAIDPARWGGLALDRGGQGVATGVLMGWTAWPIQVSPENTLLTLI